MSTAERLKPCPFCGGSAHFERMGTPRQSCIVECDSCGARLESSEEGAHCGLSWNDRTPADGGGQGVTPLSDDDALALARKHLDRGLSWEPCITRCTDREIKALIRAVERHHRIGTPASTGGSDD